MICKLAINELNLDKPWPILDVATIQSKMALQIFMLLLQLDIMFWI